MIFYNLFLLINIIVFSESFYTKELKIHGYTFQQASDKYVMLNQSNILPNLSCQEKYCEEKTFVDQNEMNLNRCIQNCQEFCIGKFTDKSHCLYNILNSDRTNCVCGDVNVICKTSKQVISFYEMDYKFVPISEYCIEMKNITKEQYSITYKPYLINCLRYAKIFDIYNTCTTNKQLERYLNFITLNPTLAKKML